jgi:hypothetical protein
MHHEFMGAPGNAFHADKGQQSNTGIDQPHHFSSKCNEVKKATWMKYT